MERRGGAQVSENVFEDCQPLKRVELKRKAWKEHWQVDTPEQEVNDEQWKNEALEAWEEVLPPLRVEDQKRAASSCKESLVVGADVFHHKMLLDECVEKMWYYWLNLSTVVIGQFRPTRSLSFVFRRCHR